MILPVSSSSEKHPSIKDTVVIGGGLMGSSAAWHLSNQGENVILIEQQDSNYTFGSSFGEARIARSLGVKNDIFSYLHNRSVTETKKLVQFLNDKEGNDRHKMEDIYTTSPVTYIYYKSREETVHSLIENQDDPIEYATSVEEASKKFGMSLPDSALVLREFKQYSGTMNPKELIGKLHVGIQHHGNAVWYNQKITALRRNKDLFEIEMKHTKTGESKTILCKKMVSAAGPYTGKLLNEIAPRFDQIITPKRVFLVFLKIDPAKYERLSPDQKQKIKEFYPVLDFTSDLVFSMIEKIDGDGVPIIKIGGHLIRKDFTNLDTVWQKDLTKEEKNWGLQSTFNYLQQLNIPVGKADLNCLDGYSCVYSLTASEIPIVTNIVADDSQPDPNLVVLGGMSGVGAKGAMTYGLIAANLLLQKEEDSLMYQLTKKMLRESGETSDTPASWFINS
ncbi:NAD(P)/FAD-dependent oxidoreductase [Rhodohalobacter sp. 614A]|uniref:NAD(P)/FAD-dependent oxidoreductase n=1 Tax=Rhodohalobacter sp. 614A TaxID=2908649 RepID=UPI001F4442C1|nr:FAD-dependent oxidoreductase [Rhodohalobacter sp. 614A]